MLKKTWAARIAPIESLHPSATKAAPTTTVGKTKGTVTKAVASLRPRNSYCETAHVIGAAASKVSTVDRTACQSVNHPI